MGIKAIRKNTRALRSEAYELLLKLQHAYEDHAAANRDAYGPKDLYAATQASIAEVVRKAASEIAVIETVR